ncbi:MAG TPA: dihydrolipoamide acetyltransferase family protein [Bacillales bacterium]|nr:dihydrolipoamide acetyltransferase family protein [Bacillales bacterium]
MATEKIVMPQLGESVTEGTISKWLIEAGDTVKKYDPIAEVMTDKVNAEVPSSFTGTIKELVASEGDTLEVGELLCYIDVDGGQRAPAEPEPNTGQSGIQEEGEQKKEASMKRRYSPAVLRLAQEHGIDLGRVEGSGRGGRITRKDVQRFIDTAETTTGVGPAEQPDKSTETRPAKRESTAKHDQPKEGAVKGDVDIPVSGVRKAIADHMVTSKREAPHAWTMVEADVTDIVRYRNAVKGEFKQKEGFSLTFLPFFIKAVVDALKEYPRMNAMWAGDKIIQKKNINISIAVATDDALYVPVIRDADEKSIKGLAKSINDLSAKVRANRLSPADTEGGTFTVNNTGSFGSVMSAPIINHPQAAILSVESIVKRPVVRDGMIGIRDMVNLCLSLDHRVLDGLICGRFLASVKEKLENMNEGNTALY